MSVFAQSTFTAPNGTHITADTPEVGGPWSMLFGTPDSALQIFVNILFAQGTLGIAGLTGTPSGANVLIDFPVFYDSAGTGVVDIWIIFRYQTGNTKHYRAGYEALTGNWKIDYFDGATYTTLGSFSEAAPTADFAPRITAVGNVLTLSNNGVSKVIVTNSSISVAGLIGVRFDTATPGLEQIYGLNSITANDAVGTGVTTAQAISDTTIRVQGTAVVNGGTAPYSYAIKRATSIGGTYSTINTENGVGLSIAPAAYDNVGLTLNDLFYYKHVVTSADSQVTEYAPVPALARIGRTYVVANTGSDSAAGDAAHPWLTLAKIETNKVIGGDSILLDPSSTFTEPGISLTIPTGGITPTAILPIIFGRYGVSGAPSIITDTSKGILATDIPYLSVEDIDVFGADVTLIPGSPNTTTFTNTKVGVQCLNTTDENLLGVTVQRMTVRGFMQGVMLGDTVVSGSVRTKGFTNFLIDSNVINHCVDWGIGIANSTNFLTTIHHAGQISNNQIDNIYGDGVNNTGYPVVAWATDTTQFFGSINQNSGQAVGPTSPGGPVSILLAGSHDNVIGPNVLLTQFTQAVANTDGQLVDIEASNSNGNIIEKTYFAEAEGEAITLLSIAGTVTNTTIRFNISQNCGRAALKVNGSTGTLVIFNTFFKSTSGGLFECDTPVTCYGNRFITRGLTTLGSFADGSVLDYNLYDCDNFSITYNGVTYTSLVAFKTATGQEAHGVARHDALEDEGNGPTTWDDPLLGADSITAYNIIGGSIDGPNLQILFGINPGTTDFHGVTLGSRFPFGASLGIVYVQLSAREYLNTNDKAAIQAVQGISILPAYGRSLSVSRCKAVIQTALDVNDVLCCDLLLVPHEAEVELIGCPVMEV